MYRWIFTPLNWGVRMKPPLSPLLEKASTGSRANAASRRLPNLMIMAMSAMSVRIAAYRLMSRLPAVALCRKHSKESTPVEPSATGLHFHCLADVVVEPSGPRVASAYPYPRVGR
jgi:hypothetical protein